MTAQIVEEDSAFQRSTGQSLFLSLFLVPVERQCVPFARYDSNKGSARSLHKLRGIVSFFYCYHVCVVHIIISHKRCINSRFRILYTYFQSSYCRMIMTVMKQNHYPGNHDIVRVIIMDSSAVFMARFSLLKR